MDFTIGQAAKKLKISHQTLRNHIKEGKVSATKTVKGIQIIEASELARAYPDRFKLESKHEQELKQFESDLNLKNKILEVEKQSLHEKVVSLETQLQESKEREQRAMQMADKHLLLLTHEKDKNQQEITSAKRGWFGRQKR